MAQKGPIIYRRLAMVIAGLGMERKEVAEALGMCVNTLSNKLRGHTAFTLDEAFRIKELLQYPGPMEELFAKNEPTERKG